MNLRQKCKRLKKENDRLKNKPIVTILDTYGYDIETIRVSRTVSKMDLEIPGVLDFIKSNIANELGDVLLPYMEFYIPETHSYINEPRYTVKAELKVAVRRD